MKLNATWIAAGLVIVTAFGCKPPPPLEPEVPASAKVKSFTVDKTEVAEGDKVTLSWEVSDAKSISIATQSGEAVQVADATAATGSTEATVEKSSVFVLTAHGEGGSDTAAVSVVIPAADPAVVFTAVPQKVIAGQSTTIVWNVPGAAQVKVSDPAGETVYEGEKYAGSLQVTPAGSGKYKLEAGDYSAEVQVEVTAGILGFAASAQAVLPGAPVTLSWKVSGAESVTLSAEGRGDLTTVTDAAQIADGSYEDTVPATLPNNGLVTYTLTARAGAKELSRSLTVRVGVDPVVSFEVPPFAKVGGAYQVKWTTQLADHVAIAVDGSVVHVATTPAEIQSGLFLLPAPAADQTVELRATNARGGAAIQTAKVSPVDVPAFVSVGVNPPTAANGGDPVTISWEVTNARHVRVTRADGKVVFDKTADMLDVGSVEVYPNGPTTYSFDADNTVGDAIQTQTLSADVTTPAKLVFTPSPALMGESVELVGTTVAGGGAIRAPDLVMKNLSGDAFVDISRSGTALPVHNGDDDNAYMVQLSSPLQLPVGSAVAGGNSISVSINGWLVFSPTPIENPTSPSTTMPSSGYSPLMFVPFGKDLEADGGSQIYWKDEGTGANRRVIVQWDSIPYWLYDYKLATFEVQLYADGRVVFAYKDVSGWSTSDAAAVGIINGDVTGAFKPTSAQLTHGMPATGDTFQFFGDLPLPYSVIASTIPIHVVQAVGQGEIDINDIPTITPPGLFSIAEIYNNPEAGQEQWFEVESHSAQAFDLGGWTIDFGGGSQTTIPTGTVLPAHGFLVFGQSANSAEESSGGAHVDVIYGTGFVMPTSSGTVSIGKNGVAYAKTTWISAATQGSSMFFSAQTGMIRSSTTSGSLSCAPTTTFGTSNHLGTPGAANTHCFPWMLTPIPSGFQSIRTTGHPVSGLQPTTHNGSDTVVTDVDFTAAGGHAVKVGDSLYGDATHKVSISSNGWMSLVSSSSSSSSNSSTPGTSAPNGTLAILWDDLAGNATDSGVFWQQFDPNGTPGDADDYTLISWENWKQYYSDGSLNFQIRIDEATGSVEYHYGTMSSNDIDYGNGSTASEWLESLDGKTALKIGANEPVIKPNTGYRFTYTP